MPQAADLVRIRQEMAKLSAASRRDFDLAFGARLRDDGSPLSQAEMDAWLDIIATYGNAAAALGAASVEEWGDEMGVRPKVKMVRAVDEARATARIGWVLTTASVLGNAHSLIDELVLQPFRSTVQSSALASGVGWGRVPSGGRTCAFCRMLASRGVSTAGSAGGGGYKYHGHCACVPVMVRDAGDFPDGYDPEELSDLYAQARRDADSGDTKAILASLRKLGHTH